MSAKLKKRSPRRSSRSYTRKRIDINVESIDFRNVELLKKFITEKGKILPRRVTGMTAKLHRKLIRAIKRARNVLLIK
ncbi:MAG: 30S ribosomal protein S18 [Verrucomicrobiota bacterium]